MFFVDFIWSTRRPGVEMRILIPLRSLLERTCGQTVNHTGLYQWETQEEEEEEETDACLAAGATV